MCSVDALGDLEESIPREIAAYLGFLSFLDL
jgi:hypothetical protein